MIAMNRVVLRHRRTDAGSGSNASPGSVCDDKAGAVVMSENADANFEWRVESECDLIMEMQHKALLLLDLGLRVADGLDLTRFGLY